MAPNETANLIEDDKKQTEWEAPKAQGLYDPQNEHEACGVGFIVAIDGKRSHKVSRRHILYNFLVIFAYSKINHSYLFNTIFT